MAPNRFVPQPVLAVVMLFPVTEPYEKARAEEDARIKDSPTAAAADFGKDELLYSKQTIGNACGSMFSRRLALVLGWD